ncbi:MAG: type II toxin-antitoxin system mRNA interferase toxin, RelE/StbE family [bacterium]|nr:type II toxin-antitoxin system mRNA interferase toxin, RelE/StbE family [bacterium]
MDENSYNLRFTGPFSRRFKQIKKDQIKLAEKILKVLYFLKNNPKYPSLHSHKVSTSQYGECWSSRVTGDLRIIWNFDEGNTLTILLLDIGGHSGKHKVYK